MLKAVQHSLSSHFVCPILAFVFILPFSAGAHAAANALVFGSFLNEHYAQQQRITLQQVLSLPIVVVAVADLTITRYRVAYIDSDSAQLQATKNAARKLGFTDAWTTTLTNIAAVTASPVASPVVSAVTASPVASPRADKQNSITSTAATEVTTIQPAALPVAPVQPADGPRIASPSLASLSLSTTGTDVNITLPQLNEGEFKFKLDGKVDEAFWANIPSYDNMLITDPDTLDKPRFATTMRWFYTAKGMYIGVHMEQPTDSLLARLSSRDEFLNRDSWGITLDTSGNGTYGYWFTVNLGGSVMDGKVAAERQYSNEWDGPWQSATAELDDGWSTEMFLPWSMMTMPDSEDGQRNFGFYVNRKVAYLDERWTWPALPFTSTAFMSVLAQMQTPGVEPGQQFELYPNISYTLDNINSEEKYRTGLDLSWRPSSNIQLTATLNPDFGVVESDDVVVNLSAFETFFPEKRLFFLEGREIFQTTPRSRVRGRGPSGIGSRQTTSTFNPEPTTLFNTRRIGGKPSITVPEYVDVKDIELGKPSDLLGAVKLTGQSGPLRYGFLSAFEDDVRLPGVYNREYNPTKDGQPIWQKDQPAWVETDGRDFGVARLLYETTGAGRQSIGYLGTVVSDADHTAIVHGLDSHWLSPNGLWQLDGQIIRSDVRCGLLNDVRCDEDGMTGEVTDKVIGKGALADIRYKPKQGVEHSLTLDWLDEKLDVSDLGFIRRNDAQNTTYRYQSSTGRGLKRLRAKSNSIVLSSEWNQDGRHVRAGMFFRNSWTFKNLNEIRTEFDYFPARWDDRSSFGNGDFKVDDRVIGEIAFGTDTSKKLSVSALIGMRQEELSDWTLRSAVGLTYKPNDRFSVVLDVNYFDRKGWLLHQRAFGRDDPLMKQTMTTFNGQEFQPRIALDLFLSAKQQLRLTLQWVGINMEESEYFSIPKDGERMPTYDGELVLMKRKPRDLRNDFTVSRLTAQLRYRWEIGPLSDLFVVYTRGSNLPNRASKGFQKVDGEFHELFSDALDQPIIDLFVIKLRYRFGS